MNELVPQQNKFDEDAMEIDLLDLLGYYMSKLPWLIAAILTGAIVAGLYTHFLVPNKFTATSRMYMVSASSDSVLNLTDLNLGTSISNDYVELMKSRPVIEEVIEELGLEYDYKTVANMVSLSVVNNTRIVKISATSTDPQEAMDISNKMAMVSQEQLPKVMEAPSPTIAEYAILPTQKSSPSLKKNVMLGALIGLVLVLGVFTVFYLLDDTIKTSEDVERLFGAMPLAVIPEGDIAGLNKRDDNKGRKRSKGTGAESGKAAGSKAAGGKV